MFVDDHVTSNLSWIEAIVPDLQQTDGLVGEYVEDEDIQCMVACINKELFEFAVVLIDPAAEVIGYQEAQYGWYGEGEELLEGGTPVHVGREVF